MYRINSCGADQEPGILLPGGIGLLKSELLHPPRKHQNFSKVKQMEVRTLKRLFEEIPEKTGLALHQADRILLPIDISVLSALIPEAHAIEGKAFSVAQSTGFLGSATSFIALDALNREGIKSCFTGLMRKSVLENITSFPVDKAGNIIIARLPVVYQAFKKEIPDEFF